LNHAGKVKQSLGMLISDMKSIFPFGKGFIYHTINVAIGVSVSAHCDDDCGYTLIITGNNDLEEKSYFNFPRLKRNGKTWIGFLCMK
jgi:hypothetical protein